MTFWEHISFFNAYSHQTLLSVADDVCQNERNVFHTVRYICVNDQKKINFTFSLTLNCFHDPLDGILTAQLFIRAQVNPSVQSNGLGSGAIVVVLWPRISVSILDPCSQMSLFSAELTPKLPQETVIGLWMVGSTSTQMSVWMVLYTFIIYIPLIIHQSVINIWRLKYNIWRFAALFIPLCKVLCVVFVLCFIDGLHVMSQ